MGLIWLGYIYLFIDFVNIFFEGGFIDIVIDVF